MNTLLGRYGASLIFIVLWAFAFAILNITDASYKFTVAIFDGVEIMLILVTLFLTTPAPSTNVTETHEQTRVYTQLLFISVIMVLILHDALADWQLPTFDIPLWTPLYRAVKKFADQSGDLGSVHIPQFIYFVFLPYLTMRWLGVRSRELGFGAGQWSKAWLQTFLLSSIWFAIPIILLALMLKSGGISVGFLIGAALIFLSAFYEEFLFRGLLQTRLRKLVTPTEAIVITSVIFGLYHIALKLAGGAPFVFGIASVLTFQALGGVALGVLFERTGNLFASTIYHMLFNVVVAALSAAFTRPL